MYNFFIRFRKQLLILTVIMVLIFQGYWLWNTFQSKKKELLEQTKVEMKEILLNEIMSELSKNFVVKSTLGKKEVMIKESYQPHENMKVFVLESRNLTDLEQMKKMNVAALKMDSLIYSSIRKSMPILFKYGDIVVVHKIKKTVSTYPAATEQSSITNNTTEEINAEFGDTGAFSIHVKNLFATTVYSILEAVLFSLIYMIIFWVHFSLYTVTYC
ncbi:hypothetical protein [Chryseobacterium sp.]|uniref:hypothetical protein n=1 Tax=Chryseobacterium sp. TaxID=1871047 RepID=UPI00289F8A53|nr:hypothetical protein [Chryseobacterium sp.]